MISDRLGAAAVLARETRFQGHVWNVETQTFELGGQRVERDVTVHPGAVAILALNERDEVLLVQQYRHPVGARLWELPAGLLDVAGEPPLLAAQRELAEETDTVAAQWQTLVDMANTPGGSNEVIRIFLATEVSAAPETFVRTEEEADMTVAWVPFEEVVAAATSMQLHNSALLIGVLALDAQRRRGAVAAPADAPFPLHPAHRE